MGSRWAFGKGEAAEPRGFGTVPLKASGSDFPDPSLCEFLSVVRLSYYAYGKYRVDVS